MKLGVQILAYNVSRFIGPVIENAGPYVDCIYVVRSPRAWGYNPGKRDAANRTTREEILATAYAHKTIILEGDWPTEDGARNACLERARQDGCDYMLIQDADEFYPAASWAANRAALAAADPDGCKVFKTQWYNFWQTTDYVIEQDHSIIGTNATFAIACRSDFQFVRKRITDAEPAVGVLPGICYHYGYVLTDEEMLEKISTWGHTSEMFNLAGWYRLKWLGWTPQTRNLHVVYPSYWPRAVRFEEKAPSFGASLELPLRRAGGGWFPWLGNQMYDLGVEVRVLLRRLKRLIRPVPAKTGAGAELTRRSTT